LEPRFQPPKAIASTAPSPAIKQAPLVKNRKALSFDNSDDEDEPGIMTKKLGSAHDRLNDKRLLKDEAYDEAARKKKDSDSVQKPSADAKKPVAEKTETKRPTHKFKSRDEPSESGSSGSDSDDSSEDQQTALGKHKADKRQSEMEALKRDIADINSRMKSAGDADGKKRKKVKVLEELLEGYKKRRKKTDQERKEETRSNAMAEEVMSFTSRLKDAVEDEFEAKVQRKKAKKAKKDKDKKEQEKKKDKKDLYGFKNGENGDMEGTSNQLWKAAGLGSDEEDEDDLGDWLNGGGLKFHTSADKAYKISYMKSKETLKIFDPLLHQGNEKVLADERKKATQQLEPRKMHRTPEMNFDLKENSRYRD